MSSMGRFVERGNTRNSPKMYSAFVSGASGAVPAMSSTDMQRARGITLIERLSTGLYKVTLDRGANDICEFKGSIQQAASTPSLTGACSAMLWKNNVTDAVSTFQFQVLTAAGAKVDPTTSDRVIFSFVPKYSDGLS